MILRLANNKYIREKLRKNKLEVLIYDKNLYTLLLNIKNDPEKFFTNLTHEEKIEFTAGITDADGYVSKDEIAIYDNNKALLEEVCRFLHNMNINCRVTRNRSIWRLRLRSKDSITLFLKLILSLKRF